MLNKKDTVTIEVHQSDYPYQLISSFKSRLDSINLSTFSVQSVPIILGPPPFENLYFVVKHRNSIETWTNLTPQFSRGGYIKYYSMINSQSSAFGNNLKPVSTKYCIYSGDVNQDKVIDLQDLILVHDASKNFSSGYVKTDLNGDNIVNSIDVNIVYNNCLSFVSAVVPN